MGGRTGIGVGGGGAGVGATSTTVGSGQIVGWTGAGDGAIWVASTTMPAAVSDAIAVPISSLEVDSRIGIFTHEQADRPVTRSCAESRGWVAANVL
jgi:hypothetical protein